jgi:hypothetical protein
MRDAFWVLAAESPENKHLQEVAVRAFAQHADEML